METVTIRNLTEEEVAEADHVMRLAFGTFLGLPEPAEFAGDASFVVPRFQAAPESAFAAELDGRLVGSNFATRWGSFAFFGPLTVRPELWDRGIARRLMEPVMARFEEWGVRHAGLFTFPHSPKHHALYERYGFFPRFLTRLVARPTPVTPAVDEGVTRFSALSAVDRAAALDDCRTLATRVFDGLDLTHEISAVEGFGLGDTLLVRDGTRLVAFAVCQHGARTEGGSSAAYVKFAAALPGQGAPAAFERVLAACEGWAASRGAPGLIAGVNLGREQAARALGARGYRTVTVGVAMHRPNETGFSGREDWVLADWR